MRTLSVARLGGSLCAMLLIRIHRSLAWSSAGMPSILSRRSSRAAVSAQSLLPRSRLAVGPFGGRGVAFASSRSLTSRGATSGGEIYIENDQKDLQLDLVRLEDTIVRIRTILGYDAYGVSLVLVDDRAMRRTNRETRGVDAPTDILSFPLLAARAPGELEAPVFDVPDYYNLGDMLVDVPYVMRRCRADQEDAAAADATSEGQPERGVSGAMATVYDPETRVHMLLVHGMLHLVGHDHETDDEYELMVAEEERILAELGLTGGSS